MPDIKIDTIRHDAIKEPSGLALQCSCGTWAMLFRNSLGLDAAYEHAQHATRAEAIAAAESRGRAAGYAEAIAALRQDVDTEPTYAENARRFAADYLERARATTGEPARGAERRPTPCIEQSLPRSR